MKKGTAQTSVEVRINNEIFETEVRINGEFVHDWEFQDEDIIIEESFQDFTDEIIRKIRVKETKLNFISEDKELDASYYADYGI